MAGTEVNLYGVGDVDLTALMNTVDLQRVTYQGLSLTNYDNDLEPAIAAGSLIENGGTLFSFGIEEAITGWAAIGDDTDAYIKLVPAGATPDTVTAEFTDVAPTWSDAKQGWYGTVASANHRYIGGLYRDDAASYDKKYLYHCIDAGAKAIKIHGDGTISVGGGIKTDATAGQPFLKTKVIEIGNWDMDALTNVNVVHGLTMAKIRQASFIIRADDDVYWYPSGYADPTGVAQLWILYIDATNIRLQRKLNGTFDGVDFDTGAFNRGWVTILYEA